MLSQEDWWQYKAKNQEKLKVDLEGYPTVIPKVLESPTIKEDAYPSRNGTENIQSQGSSTRRSF